MKIRDLNGKKICILGYGKEGHATEAALKQHAATAQITIRDQKNGSNYLANLDSFNWIIKSPGIPLLPELKSHENKITSSTQIFLDTIAETGATVIGVTGSKGKSTTSSLIHAILKAAGRDTYLIGNIGEPAISHIGDAKANTIFVAEMSSYQLADLTVSPHIAVITSFFPEHLDYHGSLEVYKDAKKNIAKFQTKGDFVLYDATSEGAKEIAREGKGKKLPFSAQENSLHYESIKLIGAHNARNIAAATTVAQLAEFAIEPSIIIDAIKNFAGLPHRLEYCGEHEGIRFYEDSISTTPESTIAAIEALHDEVDTIILGGLDRGYDFTELGKRIAASHIRTVILFPESGKRIKEAIASTKGKLSLYETVSMEEAVKLGREHTATGKVCLLSPASPSYNLYKNFEERGDAFKKLVTQL